MIRSKAAILIILVTVFATGEAVGAQATEELPASAQCGATPVFSFSRITESVYELTASAQPAGRFVVRLDYLDGATSSSDDDDGPGTIELLGSAPPCVDCVDCVDCEEQDLLAAASEICDDDDGPTALTLCLFAAEGGTSVPVTFDRKAVLRGGGFLSATYREVVAEEVAGCDVRHRGVTKVKAIDQHVLSFDVGPVYTLDGEGGWSNHAEVAVTARSEWSPLFHGGVDLRYSAIGAVAETEDDGMSMEGGDEGEGGEGGGDGEATDVRAFNPFEQGGGVFEASFHGSLHPLRNNRWLGLLAGAGASSLPGEEGAELDLRRRWFAGLEMSVKGYNAGQPAKSLGGTRGFVRFGYMDDELWDNVEIEPASDDGTTPAVFSDESERYFLNGELELPKLGTEWLRIYLRTFISVPASGDGPSDVRVSALVSVDPRSWFPGLKNSPGG